eukprot:XP_027320361.1 uncharacterized protein LOC101794414 [Anas platyrhynchos]
MAGAEKARDAIAVPVQHALRLLLFNLCPSSPELVPEENLLHPWEPQPAGCSGAARSILTLLQALVHSDGYLVHQGDEAGEKSGCEGAWPRSWGCRAPGKDVFCTPRRTLEPILENKPLRKGQRCAVGHRAGAEVPRQLLDRPNTATPIKAPPDRQLPVQEEQSPAAVQGTLLEPGGTRVPIPAGTWAGRMFREFLHARSCNTHSRSAGLFRVNKSEWFCFLLTNKP